MKHRHIFLLLLLSFVIISCDSTSNESDDIVDDGVADLTQPWITAEPNQVGVLPSILTEAADKAAGNNSFSTLVVVKNGKLIFERYYGAGTATDLQDVRSVTKSVVSTLVGIALINGHIQSLDQSVGEGLEAHLEIVPEYVYDITIRDLLTMNSGWDWSESVPNSYYSQWIAAENQMQFVIDLPRVDFDGFLYNSGAVYVLGQVLEKATGINLDRYADEYLFDKIRVGRTDWEILQNQDINAGAGLDMTARDLARFGQLFVQGGYSGKEQILTQEWIDEATSAKYGAFGSPFNRMPTMSYGYLWWTNESLNVPEYFAWGWGGQFIYIAPAKKLVVVATTDYSGLNVEDADTATNLAMNVVLDIVRQIGVD